MTAPVRWRWDVDEDTHLAAFEMYTSPRDAQFGQEVASRFASSLAEAGVQTLTNMMRTRIELHQVTILWTGEISDPALARTVFASYDSVFRALA